MSRTRVFIDGASGTTGLSLGQRLSGRGDIELLSIPQDRRRDPAARRSLLNEADVVFLCLPDDAAREAAGMIENPRVRVLDASCAHRTDEAWVYGLPELSSAQGAAVQAADRVSVPGCHATGLIALLKPLVAGDWLPRDALVSAFSLTGYTGGGKGMIADYENPSRPPAFSGTRPYALGLSHKHLPEMQRYSGLWQAPLFCPLVGDFAQGMLVMVPLFSRLLPRQADAGVLQEALAAHYEGCAFVEVMPHDPAAPPDGGFLDPQALNGTNRMQLFVFGGGEQVLLCARLDNLGKGSGGAAVQCFNLMTGAPEGCGL